MPPTSPNTQKLSNYAPKQKAVDAQATGALANGTVVSIVFNDVATATAATAGSATLPANPAGFVEVLIGGTVYKMPFYNL